MKNGLLFILLVAVFACQKGPGSGWKDLDLLPHGIPITIQAPDSVQVKASDLGVFRDVTVTDEAGFYNLQILASAATTNDLPALKANQLEEVKENPYFSQVITEDENGFVYQLKIDSTFTNYAFRYIRLQGDQEYIFQSGLAGVFTEDQVASMYESVCLK